MPSQPEMTSKDRATGQETWRVMLAAGTTTCTLRTSCDYVIRYRLGEHRRDCLARVGFLGCTGAGDLLWNARPYAGTLHIPARCISDAVFMCCRARRDDDRRYVGRLAPPPQPGEARRDAEVSEWNIAVAARQAGTITAAELAEIRNRILSSVFTRIMGEDHYQARQRG